MKRAQNYQFKWAQHWHVKWPLIYWKKIADQWSSKTGSWKYAILLRKKHWCSVGHCVWSTSYHKEAGLFCALNGTEYRVVMYRPTIAHQFGQNSAKSVRKDGQTDGRTDRARSIALPMLCIGRANNNININIKNSSSAFSYNYILL